MTDSTDDVDWYDGLIEEDVGWYDEYMDAPKPMNQVTTKMWKALSEGNTRITKNIRRQHQNHQK